MSIKNLFGSKPTIMQSANSASVDVESPDFLEALRKQREEVVPPIDFLSASNYVRFGSAKEYYAESIKRIYNTYPYDGSGKEKIEFDLSSSYLDRYILEHKYPKHTGYAQFSADSHIQINRGYNKATVPSATKISDLFSNKDPLYESSNRRKNTFAFNLDDGLTIEWWMKKTGFGTEQETILELSSSDMKMDLVLTGTTTPVQFYASSSAEITLSSIGDTAFESSNLADNNWKHYAVSISNATSNTVVDFYRDGVHKKQTSLTKINSVTSNITGFLASGSYGLLSASVDEFRYWNKKQTSESIYNNYLSGIDGGANTDDYRTELSIYYKFNEGKTTDTSLDRIVLDYSGRLANGYWHDYVADSRQSGSYTTSEVADPIIRSVHPDVQALLTEMETSGSQYDANSKMSLYDLIPQWMKDEDEESGEELKHIVQIIASYFDKLYSQIEFLTDIKAKKYYQDDEKPLPFAKRLLEERGLVVPDILINRSIVEYFGKKDLNGVQYEKDIEILKNRIYHNIYNNLEYIYKSKGTEKAYRNMLRCFGIDDEIVKLNLYTDNGNQYLTDKTKHTSQKTKHVDFDEADNFSATVYQQNFISGSGTELLEKNNAITLEAEVLVPKKPDERDSFYYNTSFVSSSVFGLDAYQGSPSSYKYSSVEDNFQAYLVRDAVDSSRAKWVLNQIDHTSVTVQSSSALVINESGESGSVAVDLIHTGSAFTMTMWVNFKNTDNSNQRFFQFQSGSTVVGLDYNNGLGEKLMLRKHTTSQTFDNSSYRIQKINAIENSEWTLIGLVVDTLTNPSSSADFTLHRVDETNGYATGVDKTNAPTQAISFVEIEKFEFGDVENSSPFMSGAIDEIVLWSKALNQADMEYLYNSGIQRDLTTHPSASFVKYWNRLGGNLNPTIGTAPAVMAPSKTTTYERHDSLPYEYDVTTKTSTKTEVLSSPFYEEIYNNQRWNIAVKAYPAGYPFAGSFLTSSSPDYTLEFYGVSHNFDEVLHEFKVTASLPYATGSALLSTAKKVYAGARRTNWSGSVEAQSDVKIAAVSLYYDKLDDQSIKQHNLDPSNYGHNRIFGNPTPFLNTTTTTHLPAQHTLALHWDFQTVTASDSSGEFTVEDFSSASVNGRYGWLGNIVTQEHKGKGFGFPASNTGVVKNEFVFASKKELPEISFTSDTITIMDQNNEYLYEDEDISDNVFAFEKSMYQVVSEEMLNMFSTMIEYSNLFAKPVDRYRFKYKRLAHAKKLFFEKTSQDLDLDRFTDYYKWIDASISQFLQQLHPASAKFNKGISDVVESHILERPKYQHLLPNIEEHKTIKEQPIRGINELTYDWAHGHSPNYDLEDFNQRAILIPANGYLQHSNAANLTGSSGEFSISFWFNSTDSTNRNLISFGGDINILVNTSKIGVELVKISDAAEQLTTASAPQTGQYVITYNGTINSDAVIIYKNGSLDVTSNMDSGAKKLAAGSFQIGFASTADTFDEVSIWNKVLTAADVTSIYNSNISQNLLTHTSASNLVSYYRMGDHPDDPVDRPYKGLIIKDSKENYDLSILGDSLGDYASPLAGTSKIPSDEENTHCLWRKDREERTGTNSTQREQLRIVVSSETYVEEIPKFGDNSGGTYNGSTYALRKFSKPYRMNASEQRAIHGGINYATPKDRDLLKPLVAVHGEAEGGLPVNVVVIGIGEGQGLVDPEPCKDVLKSPTSKVKYNTTVIVGKFSDFNGDAPVSGSGIVTPTAEFLYNIKGERLFPFNLVSGSEPTGYNSTIDQNYKKNAILTNLHSDTTTITNEIPMQGPFTEAWVGGRQSRHVKLNLGSDTSLTRPEEWLIEVGEHPDEAIVDGALGIVGPDYAPPYPSPNLPWAIHYRDGRAKRPVNTQNISGSYTKLGNYTKNYEVVQTTGRLENNKAIKDLSDAGTFIAKDIGLPATTHETSLIGVVPGDFGNVLSASSNRLTTEIQAFPTNSTGIASTDTVIATRFSAPGGFEVGSEAFLDAHAKEYSVYNSLNFRNLPVLNNSGEEQLIRVNSHASRREGLNTLHQRHCGRYGLDSTHGSVSSTDYVAEASFHKIHRNALVRPKVDKALRMPSTTDSITGIITGTAQSTYPSSGYLSVSFWAKLDETGTSSSKIVVEADDSGNNNIFIISFYISKLRVQIFQGADGGSTTRDYRTVTPDQTGWNHYVVTFSINHAQRAPIIYINKNTVFVDDVGGDYTGNIGTVAGRIALMGNDANSTASELKGSLQHFAFYNKQLNQTEVTEIYNQKYLVNTSLRNDMIDYWQLGNEVEFDSFDIGTSVTDGLSFDATIGSTSLAIDENIFISEGVESTETKNNNFYVQSTLPQSDYNYSWVDSSLGDNYSVRSGTQKVFGYWPKNGMHSSSVGYDSAITFPTASTIQGS